MANEEDTRTLVLSIMDFLRSERTGRDDFTQEDREGLEIATECLETAYGLENQESTSRRPLIDMFNQVANPVSVHDKLEAESLKIRGNEKMTQEHFEEAEADYSKAIELDKYNAIYFCNRAGARIKLQRYFEAVSDCRQALVLNPDYSKAYGRMGHAFVQMNRPRNAARCYRQALELEPDNEKFQNNLTAAETQAANAPPALEMGSLIQTILGSIFNDISTQAGRGPGPQGSIQGGSNVPSPSFVIISEPHTESECEEHRNSHGQSSESEENRESNASEDEPIHLRFLFGIPIQPPEEDQERLVAPDGNQPRNIFGMDRASNQTGSGENRVFTFSAPTPGPAFPPSVDARTNNPRFQPLDRHPSVPTRAPRIPSRFPMLFPPPVNSPPPPPPPPPRFFQRDDTSSATQTTTEASPMRNIITRRTVSPPRETKPKNDNKDTESNMLFKVTDGMNKLKTSAQSATKSQSFSTKLKTDVKQNVRQTPHPSLNSNPNPLLQKDNFQNQKPQTSGAPNTDTNRNERNNVNAKNEPSLIDDSPFFKKSPLKQNMRQTPASSVNSNPNPLLQKDNLKNQKPQTNEGRKTNDNERNDANVKNETAQNDVPFFKNGFKSDNTANVCEEKQVAKESSNKDGGQQEAGTSGAPNNTPQIPQSSAVKNNESGQSSEKQINEGNTLGSVGLQQQQTGTSDNPQQLNPNALKNNETGQN